MPCQAVIDKRIGERGFVEADGFAHAIFLNEVLNNVTFNVREAVIKDLVDVYTKAGWKVASGNSVERTFIRLK